MIDSVGHNHERPTSDRFSILQVSDRALGFAETNSLSTGQIRTLYVVICVGKCKCVLRDILFGTRLIAQSSSTHRALFVR